MQTSVSLPRFLSTLGIGLGLFTLSSTACATVYPMPPGGEDVIGANLEVRAGDDDSILTIGDRYDIGMHEMLEANPHLGIDPSSANRRLPVGTPVTVPAQFVLPPFREGIVINMPELRLYYFTPDGAEVYTYPVAMGRDAWRTPVAKTRVVSKEANPTWHVPKSIHKYILETTGENLPEYVKPGPKNPLGPYAMHLAVNGYLIHGTNLHGSVGRYVSSGCVRMHNEDVDELYHQVSIGTPVHIINYPDKIGWYNGQAYLESHVPIDMDVPSGHLSPGSLEGAFGMAKIEPASVDWNNAQIVVQEHLGMPQPIGGSNQSDQTSVWSMNFDY